MKKRIRKRRFNVRVGLPKGITQPAYNEPRQSAMDYFMNYESQIEEAIDKVIVEAFQSSILRMLDRANHNVPAGGPLAFNDINNKIDWATVQDSDFTVMLPYTAWKKMENEDYSPTPRLYFYVVTQPKQLPKELRDRGLTPPEKLPALIAVYDGTSMRRGDAGWLNWASREMGASFDQFGPPPRRGQHRNKVLPYIVSVADKVYVLSAHLGRNLEQGKREKVNLRADQRQQLRMINDPSIYQEVMRDRLAEIAVDRSTPEAITRKVEKILHMIRREQSSLVNEIGDNPKGHVDAQSRQFEWLNKWADKAWKQYIRFSFYPTSETKVLTWKKLHEIYRALAYPRSKPIWPYSAPSR